MHLLAASGFAHPPWLTSDTWKTSTTQLRVVSKVTVSWSSSDSVLGDPGVWVDDGTDLEEKQKVKDG